MYGRFLTDIGLWRERDIVIVHIYTTEIERGGERERLE